MAYTKNDWESQELITADKLNNMEDGIVDNEDNIDDLDKRISDLSIDTSNQDFAIGARWFAHRGAQSIAPENSIPAMENVYNHSGMEIDIHQTKDGQWVVMHDGNIDRMTSQTGDISSYTFEELRKIPISKGNGVSNYSNDELVIPTLEEALTIAKDKRIIPVLEIKQDSGDVYTDSSFERLAEIIDKFNMRTQVIFISFSYECLQSIKKQLPAVEVSWLIQDGITADKINKAVDLGVNSGIDSNNLITEEDVKDAHDKGLKVGIWTAANDNDREKWLSWGIDYITTNHLSGDLQYADLTLKNGWDNEKNSKNNLHVVEIADGKVLLSGVVVKGSNANTNKGTLLAELPEWALPKYQVWAPAMIRTADNVILGSVDINTAVIIGFNWNKAGGGNWVSINVTYDIK